MGRRWKRTFWRWLRSKQPNEQGAPDIVVHLGAKEAFGANQGTPDQARHVVAGLEKGATQQVLVLRLATHAVTDIKG